jgi:hypothetical protein
MPLPYLNKLRGVRLRQAGVDLANAGRVLGIDFLDAAVAYDPITGYARVSGGGSGTGAAARATAETNTFATSGTANWVGATGSAFATSTTSSDWTFTASGCIYTYAGTAAKQFLVTSVFSGNPTAGPSGYHEIAAGIDHNGDLIGTSCVTSFAPGMSQLFWRDQDYRSMVASRIVTVTNGQTVRPCMGVETLGPNTSIAIIRLTVNIVAT